MLRLSRARIGRTVLALVAAMGFFSLELSAKPMRDGDARGIVAGWLRHPGHGLSARLGGAVKGVEVYKDAAGAPLYYVVSLNPAGFVIVPADDLVEPVICFSATGKYVASAENPLYALVARDLPNRIAAARALPQAAHPTKHMISAQGKWQRLQSAASGLTASGPLASVSDLRVDRLTQSQWDQGDVWGEHCYNYYTPNHYPSGCVATAISQLMRFHQYPTAGVGAALLPIVVDGTSKNVNLIGGDGNGGPYDWANMPLSPAQLTVGGLTEAQRQAIGALCYDAGIAVNMRYTSGSSSAFATTSSFALKSVFLYSNSICGGKGDIEDGLTGMLNPNLDAGLPCVLSIQDAGSEGHDVLADGYGYDSSTLYYHLNMGWSGSSDAWYNLPVFNAGYAWKTVSYCLYNVYPAGHGEIISGRVLDTNGNPVSGAAVSAAGTNGNSYSGAVTTDARGIYAFAKVPSAASFMLSAVQPGFTFAPKYVSTGTSADGNAVSGNVGNANFVPIGTPQPWLLTVNSTPVQGAAVTGTHPGTTNYVAVSVADGTAVNLTAPATMVSGASMYNFDHWTAPADWTASGATLSGAIHGDTTLEASYTPQPVWTLAILPATGNGVTTPVPGNRAYPVGTAATILAAGGTGSVFDHWTGDGIAPGHEKDNPLSVASGTAGQTRHVSAVFVVQSTGGIQVLIVPPEAIEAGARWRVDGGDWQGYGALVYGLPVGNHTVEYKVIAGWTAPPNAQVTVARNTITTLTTWYQQQSTQWTLSVSSTPNQGVAVFGTHSGTTNFSRTVLNATPISLSVPTLDPPGYAFLDWKVTPKGAAVVTSAQKTVNFTLAADTTAVAEYQPLAGTLTVQSTPASAVWVSSTTGHSGTTNYAKQNVTAGTAVNLSVPALDPAGYGFLQWRLNTVAQTPGQKTLNFVLAGPATAVAEYRAGGYVVSVQSAPVAGVAILSATGLGDTTNYARTVSDGTLVNLLAPASVSSGGTMYNFVQWKAPATWTVSGMTASGTVHADTTLEADYAPQAGWTLAVQTPAGSGTTSPTTGSYAYPIGTGASVQANAAAGWTFDHWTGDGVASGHASDNPLSVASGTTGQTQHVAAVFVQPPQAQWTLAVSSTPNAGVQISGTHPGVTNYSAPGVGDGTPVNLSVPASDPAGYAFLDWKVTAGGTTPSVTIQRTAAFTMSADTTAVAEYQAVTGRVLNVQSTPVTGLTVGSNTGQPGQTNYSLSVAPGASVNLAAPSADPAGYTFSQWQLNGVAQSVAQKTLNFFMTSPTITAVAVYQPVLCTLNVQSTPVQSVYITSATGQSGMTNYSKQRTLAYGSTVTLSAPASDPAKYVFVQWRLNGVAQTAGQKTITFPVDSVTMTAVAEYTLVTYVLSVQSTPVTGVVIASANADGGTTNYSLNVATGGWVHLRAPTSDPPGYVFAQWRLNGTAQTAGMKIVSTIIAGPLAAVAEYKSTAH